MDLQKYQFSNEDKEFIFALMNVPGCGRATIKNILFSLKKHELKNSDFWVDPSGFFKKYNISNRAINVDKKVFKEQNTYSINNYNLKRKIRVVFFWEDAYPKLLREIADYPLFLYVQGPLELLQSQLFAVVGTRRVTSYGRMVTQKLVGELVAYGLTIVSGCMYGVDQVAHQTVLNEKGKTIAVLGYGFDQVPQNMQLFQKNILKSGGCLVTEYAPEVSASKMTFPERNRIVAGMCKGVLVTEAALKSGTHITVNCALDAGRDIFAIPGSILNPYSAGTTYLINQGAQLVCSGADIVAEFNKIVRIPDSNGIQNKVAELETYLQSLNLSEKEICVVKEVIFLPQTTNELLQKVHCTIPELLRILGVLELENIVQNEAGVWHSVLSYSGHV